MGNGTCQQQIPSLATIDLIDQKKPLPNSQQITPTKPTIDSINPTIAIFEEEGPNISIEAEEEKEGYQLSNFSQAGSPTKEISKQRQSQEDQFFLDLFQKDKTFLRRLSQGQSISPVRIVASYHKKHKTQFIVEHSEIIRIRQEIDEISQPKSILKSSIHSQKSLSSQSLKKVQFGLIYKQI